MKRCVEYKGEPPIPRLAFYLSQGLKMKINHEVILKATDSFIPKLLNNAVLLRFLCDVQ